MRAFLRRLVCLFSGHDLWSEAQGYDYAAPPHGHPCRPALGDTPEEVARKYIEWTRLRCLRCPFTFPKP